MRAEKKVVKKQKLNDFDRESGQSPCSTSSSTCRECGESFETRNKLFRHINLVHNQFGTDPGTIVDEVSTIDRDNIPAKYSLPTIYEDEISKIIIKPQGLACMGQKGLTVFNHPDLSFQLPNGVMKKCIPAHRLDKLTGGLMLCGKTKRVEVMLKVCLLKKWVQKKYIALVVGRMETEEGYFDKSINNKSALTKYRVVSCTRSLTGDWITTAELWPITGRKHQLRRHLSLNGHPIIGDKRFCPARLMPKDLAEMCLWAVELTFPSPVPLFQLFTEHYFPPLEQGAETDQVEEVKECQREEEDEEDSDGEDKEDNKEEDVKGIDRISSKMQDIPKIIVSIPEPIYYEEYRRKKEEEWERRQKEV